MAEAGIPADATTLPFIVAVDGADGDEKGLFGRTGASVALRQVPVAALRQNLHQMVTALRALFDEIAGGSDRLSLKEVQLSFEVTASGGVQLLGVGGEVGSTGAVTLTFGR